MTKNRKKIVTDNKQLSLLDLLIAEREERQETRPGRLNIVAQINAAIKKALKDVPKSRETVADEMSELTGERITADKIGNWLAESHPHEMPGRLYAAFCVATGDVELLRIQAEAAGIYTVKGPDALRAEIQKLDEEAKKINGEKKKRLLFLQELEGQR
jgi:hypothetical protein